MSPLRDRVVGVLPIACVALCAGVLLAAPPSRQASPLVVSAAISLTDAFRDIERAYTAAGGGPVRFNFAGSNVLARQIVNGAPADVFISADAVQMDYAQRAGAIDPPTRRNVVANRLAVIVPHDARVPIGTPRDLASPAVRRIAIGDPAAVPAGQYARQYLEHAGLWTAVQSKLLPLANVRAAVAAAQSGGVDAAIVYESDAVASNRVVLAYVVPDAETPRIVYPGAIVARSANRAAAERFLAFLHSAPAREIFERYRFRPLPERTR